MSELLDNKTDSQIEEIYNLATMEDLQNMLIQEKSLNRRRLLRKVMREKSTKSSDNTKSEEMAQSINNKNENCNHSGDIVQSDTILKRLDELKNELNNITDLTRRRELRKEIQQLEEKKCDCNSEATSVERITSVKETDKVDGSFNKSKVNRSDSQNIEDREKKEIKYNTQTSVEKAYERQAPKTQESSLTTLKSNVYLLSNQMQPSSTKDQVLPQKIISNTEEKIIKNENTFSSLKRLNSSNPVSDVRSRQTSESALPAGEKQVKISRVSSMRDMFEKPKLSTSIKPLQKDETIQSITQNNIEKGKFSDRVTDNHSSSLKSFPSDNSLLRNTVKPPNEINKLSSQTVDNRKEQKPQISRPLSTSNTFRESSKTEINERPIPMDQKTNILRPGNVKEKLEQPGSQTSNTQRKTATVKLLSDNEINDLVNSILKMDEPKPTNTGGSSNLHPPEQRQRKTSQTNIIKMIPQMKKMAKTARSTVQAMKEQIIAFCQGNTQEYENVQIVNYSKSWADGLAFCALIHHFYPNSFDYGSLSSKNPLYNFKLAFETAKKYANIEPLIDPEDMLILENPDEKCVYTYVQFMYNALKQHPRNMLKRLGN